MFKIYCQENIAINIKHAKIMAQNIESKKVAMTVTIKVIRDKSRCDICRSNKSKFLEDKPNKKSHKKWLK